MSDMLHSAIDQIRTPGNLAPLIRQAVRDLEAELATLTAERDGLLQTIAVNEGDLDEKRDMLNLISSEGVPDATLWLAMKQQRDGAIAERDALREALAPSGETKGEYIGEVSQSCVNANDGYEEDITWTATKDIMKMILARAARNV